MSDNTDTVNYDYDEEAAGHADDFVNRIDHSAAYEGAFTRVWPFKAKTGTKGVHFEFEAPGGAKTTFDLYTVKEDGTKLFSYNMLMAMLTIMGLKGLRSKPGVIEAYNEDTNKREETTGETFPDLCGKSIGVVLQKELYTKGTGKEGYRMNLLGTFHTGTRLTASEMREGVKKADAEQGKLARMVRGLKTKDSRTVTSAEPAQPSQGLPAGDY